MTCHEVIDWHTPATDYGEETVGNHRLAKMVCRPGVRRHMPILGRTATSFRQPVTLTVLQEMHTGRWHDWMADDPYDYWAMQVYARAAHGKVVTAGLGLGLLAHELFNNPMVTSITILERSADVVALVYGYLPADDRLSLIVGDYWEYLESGSNFDTIITDTWRAVNSHDLWALFSREVTPARDWLRAKYPAATLVFHGFPGASDIPLSEPVSPIESWAKPREAVHA